MTTSKKDGEKKPRKKSSNVELAHKAIRRLDYWRGEFEAFCDKIKKEDPNLAEEFRRQFVEGEA